jgi:hypothetical protein
MRWDALSERLANTLVRDGAMLAIVTRKAFRTIERVANGCSQKKIDISCTMAVTYV